MSLKFYTKYLFFLLFLKILLVISSCYSHSKRYAVLRDILSVKINDFRGRDITLSAGFRIRRMNHLLRGSNGLLYIHSHNYINNNRTYTYAKTQANSVVQVRTVLLTSDFGFSTSGERHNARFISWSNLNFSTL